MVDVLLMVTLAAQMIGTGFLLVSTKLYAESKTIDYMALGLKILLLGFCSSVIIIFIGIVDYYFNVYPLIQKFKI